MHNFMSQARPFDCVKGKRFWRECGRLFAKRKAKPRREAAGQGRAGRPGSVTLASSAIPKF